MGWNTHKHKPRWAEKVSKYRRSKNLMTVLSAPGTASLELDWISRCSAARNEMKSAAQSPLPGPCLAYLPETRASQGFVAAGARRGKQGRSSRGFLTRARAVAVDGRAGFSGSRVQLQVDRRATGNAYRWRFFFFSTAPPQASRAGVWPACMYQYSCDGTELNLHCVHVGLAHERVRLLTLRSSAHAR